MNLEEAMDIIQDVLGTAISETFTDEETRMAWNRIVEECTQQK